jgi:monoamine oxidase
MVYVIREAESRVPDRAVGVIVVGGGIAGLTAAYALAERGLDVRLFEARDRLGGRVWSVPFAGGTVERGGEFLLDEHTEVARLAERLGLSLAPKGTPYGHREPRGAGPWTWDEIATGADRLRGAAPPPGSSVASALDSVELAASACHAIEARIEMGHGCDLEQLDAGHALAAGVEFADVPVFGVRGGNGRLIDVLAGRLGDRVERSAPVHWVRWSPDRVEVATPVRCTTAAALVVAAPASALASIRFDPPIPQLQPDEAHRVTYGVAAKLFVALDRPAPPSAVMSVPGRFWTYTQLDAHGDPDAFVGSFAGGTRALERLEVGSGSDRWLSEIEALRPDLRLDPAKHLLTVWPNDCWVAGHNSVRTVSSEPWNLSTPIGPIAFAGEHTGGEFEALIEGAVRSGLRAADQISICLAPRYPINPTKEATNT